MGYFFNGFTRPCGCCLPGTAAFEGLVVGDFIPEGIYKVRKRYTSKFGWHLLFEDVPNRDMILVHAFNNAVKESKGCIAPVAMVTGDGKGTLSGSSLKHLMELLDPDFRKLKPVSSE